MSKTKMFTLHWPHGRHATYVAMLTPQAYESMQIMVNERGEKFNDALSYVLSVFDGCSLSLKKKDIRASMKEFETRYEVISKARGRDEFHERR